MDTSPRKLVSSLQRHLSPCKRWRVRRTHDLAAEDIVRERRAAIESGRLKGRRLFGASTEGAATELGLHGKEDNHSIQGSEVRSLCYDTSSIDDNDHDDDDDDDDGHVSCLPSSLSMKNRDRDEKKGDSVGVIVGRSGDGGKWVVRMRWFGLVLIVCSLVIITWMSFDGEQDVKLLIPT